MTQPTTKSRKLAWVVLGAVVLGSVALLVQLSSLYTPWERNELVTYGPPGGPHTIAYEFRRQKFPWLPGADWERRFLPAQEGTKQ